MQFNGPVGRVQLQLVLAVQCVPLDDEAQLLHLLYLNNLLKKLQQVSGRVDFPVLN